MKKNTLILLLILSLGILMAVESAPSESVGYFKKAVASDGWEAFSLPFGYPDLTPDAVLGTQFGDLDTVSDMATGENVFYIDGVGWLGSIVDMVYGHAYWIYRDMANPALNYFLLGKVNPQIVSIHVSGDDEGNWAPFSLNEARLIDVNTLPITGVVDIDTIVDITTGENSFYIDGVGWLGSLLYIEPTHAYWYNSLAALSYDWTYTPGARGASAPVTGQRSLPSNSKVNR